MKLFEFVKKKIIANCIFFGLVIFRHLNLSMKIYISYKDLSIIGEKNIAIRFSEFESIESVELVKNMVKWVWIDCFTKFPLDLKTYNKIKNLGLKICLVSPELQGYNTEKIKEFKEIIKINSFKIDAICTKYYNIKLWKIEDL